MRRRRRGSPSLAVAGLAVTMLLAGCAEGQRGSPTPEPTPDLAREIRHWLIAEIHMPDPSPPRPPFATVPIYAMFCQVDGELTFVREEACPLLTGAFTLRVTPALEEAAPMDAQIPYCLQREDGGEYRVAIHGVCVLRIDSTMQLIDELWPAAIQSGLVNGDVLPWCDMGDFPDYRVSVGPPCAFGRSWPSIHVGSQGRAFVNGFADCSAMERTLGDLEARYQPLIAALADLDDASAASQDAALDELRAVRDDLARYRFSIRLHPAGSDGTIATHRRILLATDDVLNSAAPDDLRVALELTEATAAGYATRTGCSH